jgi:peptidoglycan/xylan/chitin deacetylase (PgdA/CDA1 family)
MALLQITIDDGPDPAVNALDPMLEELTWRRNENGNPLVAAFFNLGEEVQSDPGSTQTISRQGHVLGNHSWDHLMPRTHKYGDSAIFGQFRRTQDEVFKATNVSMLHWRAPRLEQISRLTRLLVHGPDALFTLSHCDVHADSKDSLGANDAASMLRALQADIKRDSKRGVFRLLFHVKPTTAVAFRAVLSGLEDDGHTLVDFSQIK